MGKVMQFIQLGQKRENDRKFKKNVLTLNLTQRRQLAKQISAILEDALPAESMVCQVFPKRAISHCTTFQTFFTAVFYKGVTPICVFKIRQRTN